MSQNPSAIVIDPVGQEIQVTITRNSPAGAEVTTFTEENGTSAWVYPATVSARTVFWLPVTGNFYVSGLNGASETLGRTLLIEKYQVASLVATVIIGGLDEEQVEDTVGAMLVEGANITLTYDDASGTVTVAATGGGGYSDEAAQDAIGGILVDSAEIDFTYSDGTPSITATLKAASIDEAKLDASVNASLDLADSAIQNLVGLSITATATELNYTSGVTSAIQTQLGTKAPLANPTFTGTVAGITKSMVGLGSVDNTADTAKPVSTAQQTALDLKAPLASPTFTGTVTLPVGLTGVLRADTGVVSADSDVTDIVSAATTSLAGKVELATDAETTTGTDTVRAITPSNLTAQIGTRVQAFDADLSTIAGLTATTNNFLVAVASAWASRTPAQVKVTLAIVAADISDFTSAAQTAVPPGGFIVYTQTTTGQPWTLAGGQTADASRPRLFIGPDAPESTFPSYSARDGDSHKDV